MHREVYRQNPDIHSIIIAHPPARMAFNVTKTPFDTRIIPEAYILLRDIKTLPFATPISDYQTMAREVGPAQPILMIQNNGVIVTGVTLLQAFDRLEVAEFSAKAVFDALNLGKVNSIGDQEIRDLKVAFKLTD
jgi:L-fuculose-phosphate aldolase